MTASAPLTIKTHSYIGVFESREMYEDFCEKFKDKVIYNIDDIPVVSVVDFVSFGKKKIYYEVGSLASYGDSGKEHPLGRLRGKNDYIGGTEHTSADITILVKLLMQYYKKGTPYFGAIKLNVSH